MTLTMRPECAAIAGSISSRRILFRRARVPVSIGTHEARIADHIGRQDSCKPPLQSFFSHMDRSAPVS